VASPGGRATGAGGRHGPWRADVGATVAEAEWAIAETEYLLAQLRAVHERAGSAIRCPRCLADRGLLCRSIRGDVIIHPERAMLARAIAAGEIDPAVEPQPLAMPRAGAAR
jgi:hypothetical protein